MKLKPSLKPAGPSTSLTSPLATPSSSKWHHLQFLREALSFYGPIIHIAFHLNLQRGGVSDTLLCRKWLVFLINLTDDTLDKKYLSLFYHFKCLFKPRLKKKKNTREMHYFSVFTSSNVTKMLPIQDVINIKITEVFMGFLFYTVVFLSTGRSHFKAP